MKKSLYVALLLFAFFLGTISIYAGPGGSGGTGEGGSSGVTGGGKWKGKDYFGFYIGVYDSNNNQKGKIYQSKYNVISGWVTEKNNVYTSHPTKLYDYLKIPYSGNNNNYSTLLEIINSMSVTLQKGDYIIVEPFTNIGGEMTFRSIINNTDQFAYWYEAPALILANAAKVGHDITVGGNKYTAPNGTCNKAQYQNKKRCGVPKNSYLGYGLTVVSYDDIFKNGKLYIEKRNSSKKPIINNSASFQVFSDSSCKIPVSGLIYTNTAGNATIELSAGKYYLKEISAPKGYNKSNECMVFTIEADKTEPVYVENTQTCDSEFAALKQDGLQYDIASRIRLFEKYKKYQLLNFNEVDNPCSTARNCGTDISGKPNTNSSCTNTNINYNLFNEKDLSCYSSIEKINDKNAYCIVEYNYNSSFLSTYNKSSFINAGRIIFQDLDNLGTGYLQKRCYAFDTNITLGDVSSVNFSGEFKYSNYVKNLSILDQNLDTNISAITYIHNTSNEFIGRYNLTYSKLNYIKKVSGLLSNEKCGNDCITVNGLITRFELENKINEDSNYTLKFNPKLDLTDSYSSELSIDSLTNTDACEYNFNKQIIKNDKPNLEFRIIDTKNPFPGKAGNGRTIGSNWCTGDSTCTSAGIENYSALQKIEETIINKPNGSGINPDGTKATPKYTIDLNYKTIKDIREYNKNHTLDSFEQICDNNGENCKSVFLMTFATKNE